MEAAASKAWFIRHGCSIFNLWGRWYYKVVPETELSLPELSFVKSMSGRFDTRFLDAPLCPLGKSQSVAAQSVMAPIPIKYVIVSPLERTLETARIIFSAHPFKSRIQFIVHPMIRECITHLNAIPNWTLEMQRDKFATRSGLRFDFGMLERLHPGTYFLETMDEELKEIAMSHIKSVGEKEYTKVMIKLLSKKYRIEPGKRRYLESYSNTRKRAKVFLEWLKDFIKEKKISANEVAVVTHMTFLSCLAAKEFDRKGKPIYPYIPNAKPFEIDIDKLLNKHY